MSDEINVLALLIREEGGGAETSVRRILDPLLQRNVLLKRVVCDPPKTGERPHSLRVLNPSGRRSIFAVLISSINLKREILSLKPDLVHLHCERPEIVYCLARLLWPKCKSPVVFTEHSRVSYENMPTVGRIVRFCLKRWNAQRVNCFDAGDSEFPTIFNASDSSDKNFSLGVGALQGRLVFIGRLIELKRVTVILKALKLSNYSGGFLIIGDGPERKKLEEMVTFFDLKGVVFAGYQAMPWTLVQRGDVFISASRREGEPLAVVEAISKGIAMLLSNIPAHSVLAESDNMLFYDESSLASKLRGLPKSMDTYRPSLGWSTQIMTQRSPDVVASRWRELYSQVIEKSH